MKNGGGEVLKKLGTSEGVIYVRPNWIKECVINVRCRASRGEIPKKSVSHSQNLDWPSRTDRGELNKIYLLSPGTGGGETPIK